MPGTATSGPRGVPEPCGSQACRPRGSAPGEGEKRCHCRLRGVGRCRAGRGGKGGPRNPRAVARLAKSPCHSAVLPVVSPLESSAVPATPGARHGWEAWWGVPAGSAHASRGSGVPGALCHWCQCTEARGALGRDSAWLGVVSRPYCSRRHGANDI